MRNAPKPSASTTARVWFAGRYRFAIPWRTTYGHPDRSSLRAANERRAALIVRNPSTIAIPPLIDATSLGDRDRRLRHVDHEHLAARRAQAAQHSDDLDLPRHERVHTTRDADPA